MRTITRLLAIACMFACAACNNTKTANLNPNESVEVSSIHWDESIAATQYARPNNASLIAMR